jgi:hypothetical protein
LEARRTAARFGRLNSRIARLRREFRVSVDSKPSGDVPPPCPELLVRRLLDVQAQAIEQLETARRFVSELDTVGAGEG